MTPSKDRRRSIITKIVTSNGEDRVYWSIGLPPMTWWQAVGSTIVIFAAIFGGVWKGTSSIVDAHIRAIVQTEIQKEDEALSTAMKKEQADRNEAITAALKAHQDWEEAKLSPVLTSIQKEVGTNRDTNQRVERRVDDIYSKLVEVLNARH